MNNVIYRIFQSYKNRKGYFCLIDPDKFEPEISAENAVTFSENGADAILVGSSIMLNDNFDDTIRLIKENVKIPVIIFPGKFNFVSKYADAILLLSMVSSRNPDLLISEQVRSAPLIKKYNLESIGTGYMLIESGSLTSVQYMSNSLPIPRNKADIAVAHALAAEFLGMKTIYLEAGSGAKHFVPEKLIKEVKKNITIPLIVGGGIKNPESAAKVAQAGADIVVTGTIFENGIDKNLIREFAKEIHNS
jgi:putative glycerol-1-phosphate prenyltransferase